MQSYRIITRFIDIFATVKTQSQHIWIMLINTRVREMHCCSWYRSGRVGISKKLNDNLRRIMSEFLFYFCFVFSNLVRTAVAIILTYICWFFFFPGIQPVKFESSDGFIRYYYGRSFGENTYISSCHPKNST